MYLLYRCTTINGPREYLCEDGQYRSFMDTQTSSAIAQGHGLRMFPDTQGLDAEARTSSNTHQYLGLQVDEPQSPGLPEHKVQKLVELFRRQAGPQPHIVYTREEWEDMQERGLHSPSGGQGFYGSAEVVYYGLGVWDHLNPQDTKGYTHIHWYPKS